MRDIVQGDVDYIRPKDQIYRRDEKVIYEYPPCKNCVSFERISNKVGSNAFTYFPKHPIENSCQHLHFKNPSNLGQFDTANSSRQFQNGTRKAAKIYQPNAKLFAIVQDDTNIPYFKNSYHTRYSKGSELHKSKLKRWNSEESSLYISKNLTDCERSDSYVKISPHTRKVSISNSTEVLYDTPYFYEQVKSKVSHPSISSIRSHTQQHSRQPLKSVLKNTGRLQTTVEEYSALEIDPQDGNDNDVYDPSLPYIPLFEDEHASLESTVLSQFSESSDSKSSSGSRSGKSGGSAQLKLSPRNIASVNPALNEWFDALELTSKLGWTLILYLAIRSHYNPITFAKLLFQVDLPLIS
ncbi:hypothetical protein Avbf_07842 [Armadillidium vulgare]|nr:hypothetical protein Avbf_07842 [Armadillidium vulgare]